MKILQIPRLKKCTECSNIVEFTKFPKRKSLKSGFGLVCKECKIIYLKNYRLKNKEQLAIKRKQYIIEHKDSMTINRKRYEKENKDMLAEKRRTYFQNNKESIAIKAKKYQQENKIEIAINKKKYCQDNKVEISENKKRYYDSERGKEQIEEYRDIRNKKRRHYNSTPIGKLECFCRKSLRRIIYIIKEDKKIKTIDAISYTSKELKRHIESQFTCGMSWDNHSLSGWHIDHIIPLGHLVRLHKDKSQEEILNIVNALDNLQPLWATDNLKKSDSV